MGLLKRVGARRILLMASLSGLVLTLLTAGTLCLTSGCASIGYLTQSASGHLGLLASAHPVDDWLKGGVGTEPLPEPIRQRLIVSQRMRDFAVSELKLPDNRSYRGYADLKRPAAVWNVVAAPELSLKLQTWCFPIVGCVGYRGYFDQDEAERAGQALRAQGLEVDVYPVPAYSTLGYSDWLGGDPLLSSFIQWPESELARLIFHELSHQLVYAEGDTMFNESFATTVERLGGERWLATQSPAAAREQYRQIDARRADFRALTLQARGRLEALYASEQPDPAKRQAKAVLIDQLRADYDAMKRNRWGGYAGYDAFFEHVNNASLGVQAAYTQWVPAFDVLFERQGRDFHRFYVEVQRLAQMPRAQRDATLSSWMPATAPG